jgi:hypothetical protein
MTKRENKLARITAIVAKEGRSTPEATRIYLENRDICHTAFNDAAQKGWLIFEKRRKNVRF